MSRPFWLTSRMKSPRSPSLVTKIGSTSGVTFEVTGYLQTLDLGAIDFLSLRETHSLFHEAVGPSGAERLGTPSRYVGRCKNCIRARVQKCWASRVANMLGGVANMLGVGGVRVEDYI